ncbi:5-formyltetrahydrofolate cyclo-ligase [Streptomyces zingiberis]|uniref:5-formyltetrahydrofolate cyclo-ligase n=1 Tax=Streptomyces zingiberis TaxID=2053010 RepID=A0ABX1BWX9_9ACTN|nr:5-formyltetrahydrofolate cyclo-ligase [Streptomyces zingiberis]NJP99813.1 5-formyltetrahydrofolate cyclo-ligase [Streptomyces zingiberis]
MSTQKTRKAELRHTLGRMRSRLTEDDITVAGAALARHALRLPELASARTVCAYVSVGREPGTGPLLDALRARGVRVLLPVLRDDDDLDWGPYTGPERLVAAGRPGRLMLREPADEPLGRRAVLAADALLLPGLAVDGRGLRLGRGGGSYDRVLERLAEAGAHPALIVLLYDGEVVDAVPAEPHDRPVRAAVTPSGVHRFPADGPR